MSDDSRAVAAASKPEEPASQLLFYSQPEPLHAARHGRLHIAPRGDYRFARETNSVPITVSEFASAMCSFPIVFVGDAAYPVAVLGLEQRNVFVSADGSWKSGAYVPAYIRRYPFVFIAQPDDKGFVLGVDRACDRVVEHERQAHDTLPLFEDGKPAKVTEDALLFCAAYHGDHQHTAAFGQALAEHSLLVDNRAQASLPGGRLLDLQGFRVVDRSRLAVLPDKDVCEWHRKGWLALCQAHLASLDRWRTLLDREMIVAP